MIFKRFISTQLKQQLDKLVKEEPVLVFMKGTPKTPQCGFSRAVCQILEIQGLHKFTSIDVLQDEKLRSGLKEYT
jgi:monothiol glutaredoxin